MLTDAADDFVPFPDVRVIGSTAAARFCRIGEKSVWLPRALVSDHGRAFLRRRVVIDHGLREEPIGTER